LDLLDGGVYFKSLRTGGNNINMYRIEHKVLVIRNLKRLKGVRTPNDLWAGAQGKR
jgi:hypothetical protein